MSNGKQRAIVYIDGYNWYHAIFKHYPEWKWLNVQTFFEALRRHDSNDRLKDALRLLTTALAGYSRAGVTAAVSDVQVCQR